MIADGQKCRHCSGKMSKPKLVLDGPSRGKTRVYCLQCGHLEFVSEDTGQLQSHTAVSLQIRKPAQSVATPVATYRNSSEPTMVQRNGQWEIC
jgi:hypothetical protein